MVSITNYADKQVQRMTWINGLWLVQGVQDLSWTSRSPRFIGLWLVQGVQDLSWTSQGLIDKYSQIKLWLFVALIGT
jgi:hypothetical protein